MPTIRCLPEGANVEAQDGETILAVSRRTGIWD